MFSTGLVWLVVGIVMFSTGMMWGQVANRGSLNPTVAAGHIGHLREVPMYGIVGTLGTLRRGWRAQKVAQLEGEEHSPSPYRLNLSSTPSELEVAP